MNRLMNRIEIIEETAAFYNLDNRATQGTACFYNHPSTGCRCAVGRCMTEEAIVEYGGYYQGAEELHAHLKKKGLCLNNLLKEEYRGHALDFWTDIQSFHDTRYYWDSHGLTPMGLEQKNFLIDKWKND